MEELRYSLSHSRNSSQGEDEVYYGMLKHLPEHGKGYLLEIYNKCFQVSYFPERWRRAIVVPILKPKKDGSSAANYRPIALTSCLCKLFDE